MRSSQLSTQLSKLVAVFLSVSLSACAAIEAQRQANEVKQQQYVQHMDIAHIYVTPDDAPAGKPYKVLGELTYSEKINPEDVADAIDAHKMNEKLKAMANEKYPDSVDAVIKAHSDVSSDGSLMTVNAEAIQFDSSTDREALHHMNEGLVASPNGD
jgi:uncharacterized protein involved in high-affinity Fe2+ transport